MKNILLGSSLLLLSAAATAVEAPKTVATIADVQGSVLVEHTNKRMPATAGMSLQEGDTVFVLEKATVDLAYAGCNSTLEQNTLLTVSANTPCAAGDVIGVGVVELTVAQNAALQQSVTSTGISAASTAAQVQVAAATITEAGLAAGISQAAISEAVAAAIAGAGASGTAAVAAAITAGITSVAGATTAVSVVALSGGTLAIAGAAAAATIAVVDNASGSDTPASP